MYLSTASEPVMLGICKSAKSIPRKPQTRFAQTVGFSGNNADFQMPSITKTLADIDKYIYIPELVLAIVDVGWFGLFFCLEI